MAENYEHLVRTSKEWLPIAIREIRAKMKKLKVHDTGELYRTLTGSIREISAGNVYRAQLLYRLYGIFPDIGVGKGVPKDEVRLQKMLQGGRRAKNWTKEVAHQSHLFGDLMRDAYADQAVATIRDNLIRRVVMKF